MWQGWVNRIIGIWLLLAPFVSMDVPSVKLNNLYIGVLAAVVSGYTPTKNEWGCWLGIAAGVWIAFSSFFHLFVQGTGYLWNNVVSGVLIFASGTIASASSPTKKQAHRSGPANHLRDERVSKGTDEAAMNTTK